MAVNVGGAVSMAATGAAIAGPWGAVAGAVVGAVMGGGEPGSTHTYAVREYEARMRWLRRYRELVGGRKPGDVGIARYALPQGSYVGDGEGAFRITPEQAARQYPNGAARDGAATQTVSTQGQAAALANGANATGASPAAAASQATYRVFDAASVGDWVDVAGQVVDLYNDVRGRGNGSSGSASGASGNGNGRPPSALDNAVASSLWDDNTYNDVKGDQTEGAGTGTVLVACGAVGVLAYMAGRR